MKKRLQPDVRDPNMESQVKLTQRLKENRIEALDIKTMSMLPKTITEKMKLIDQPLNYN